VVGAAKLPSEVVEEEKEGEAEVEVEEVMRSYVCQ
jgi:hypothetical protein